MVFFIAEIGINHNGSIDIAKKLIDIAVGAGVAGLIGISSNNKGCVLQSHHFQLTNKQVMHIIILVTLLKNIST